MKKKCRGCNIKKNIIDFYKGTGKEDHLCKPCRKIRDKAYRDKPDIKIKKAWRLVKKIYGISYEDYMKMFRSQNGACAICNNPKLLTKRRMHIDHDHTTGKVRGLLCHNCNLVLGHAKDSAKILMSAVVYLYKQGTNGAGEQLTRQKEATNEQSNNDSRS